VLFDFLTRDKLIKNFFMHFNVEDKDRDYSWFNDNNRNTSPFEIVKKWNINLLISTNNCHLLCRHLTTCSDNAQSIRKRGLLNLSEALVQKTDLSCFLKDNGIKIDPYKYRMKYKENWWEIKVKNFEMEGVSFNELINSKKDDFEFNKEMNILYNKLYFDRGEIECFLRTTDSQAQAYSLIFYCPEILITIGKIINAFDETMVENYLQTLWQKKKGYAQYYVDFKVPYCAVDMNISHKHNSYYDENENWFDYAGYTYEDYICDNIPIEFYHNKHIIENLYYSFFSNEQLCGQILPEYKIEPDTIICINKISKSN